MAMPYSKEHKEKTRARIVDAARRLFNRHGFAGVSIDDIMAEAGLTRGGFYNHFGTKEELYAAVVSQVIDGTPASNWSRGECNASDTIPEFVTAYLSREHLENREDCCSLMALPSDVARGGKPVKRAYRQVFEYMVENLQKDLSGSDARQRGLAIAALCIGAMTVARAIDDKALAREIREAARKTAFSVAGWSTPHVEAAE
jgi:TetR/AcrR family transcriptional regulator, transcriptional repressor for nem operon